MAEVKTIAIVTSGNDAPGMNSAIRAVTRSAIYNGLRVKAVYRGYKGLIDGEIVEFKTQNVSNIIQQGGTILKSSPSKDFRSEEGRKKAFENIQKEEIDAVIVIGGDGTIHGARIFAQEYDIPCIAIPATIDNNLCGTDTTIGYDTALNTIMQCVDKIRDTATSHERLFFVEVMGDDAGFLALNCAIASGCEDAIIPSVPTDVNKLATLIESGFRKTKGSSIVLVAASEDSGGALYYADEVKKAHPNIDVRISILGHLQRGGSPSARDRILASCMGVGAIEAIKQGQRNVMVGYRMNEIVYVPFTECIRTDKRFDKRLINVLDELSI
jgi:6-phosphofructokinase 1